jgi:hypothetical protein
LAGQRKFVQWLHPKFTGWLKENKTAVFDVSCRVGIFSIAAVFLHSLGADTTTAAAIGGVALKSPLSKKKGRKKKGGKK